MMPQPALAEAIGGTFTLQIENDRIANTNRHYTHGRRQRNGLTIAALDLVELAVAAKEALGRHRILAGTAFVV